MNSFLIDSKLWHIVTEDIVKPTQLNKEDDSKFIERLEEWDSTNHQIITWLGNTSIPTIHAQFDAFEDAKKLWHFFSTLFKSISLTHYYQLQSTVVNLNQDVGQSVNKYLGVIQPIRSQLEQAKINKDHLRLIMVWWGYVQIMNLLGLPYHTTVSCDHWMQLSKVFYLKKNDLASIAPNNLMLYLQALIHPMKCQTHFVCAHNS